MAQDGLIIGSLDINILLGFVFGVVFIITMLVFAIKFPNPSPFTQWVFITVLALASAGIGSVMPGIIHIDLPYAQAGGALALFVLVFSTKPAIVTATARVLEPASAPEPVIAAFLDSIDNGDYEEAFDQLDEVSKSTVARDRVQLKRIYLATRKPLGDVVRREENGVSSFISPNGYPMGAYRAITYKTRFSLSPPNQCYNETVVVRANDELSWKVFNHTINPHPIPCGFE